MSEQSGTARDELVRRQEFEVDGPVEVRVEVGSGRVDIALEEPREGAPAGQLSVEVRHDPADAGPWAQGVAGLISWVSGQLGEDEPTPADAVRRTRVELADGQLTVRTPGELQLRGVPLAVGVRAPAGSRVSLRSTSANLTVSGRAGRLDVATGSGEISTGAVDGPSTVRSGSGPVRLGQLTAGVRARTGTGRVEIAAASGTNSLFTGSGDIRIGAVTGDVLARSGTGDVVVSAAGSGRIELTTGSGAIRVGIRPGSPAEIELTSGSGQARSELELSGDLPASEPVLWIRGRTGSGDAVVTAAD